MLFARENKSKLLLTLKTDSKPQIWMYENHFKFVKTTDDDRAWCTGKTQRNQVEREVGGGIGMGNTCKSMADSCQCITKTTRIL